MVASEKTELVAISVVDAKNERIAGAAVEVVGTGKVFYTNINGICFIPKNLLNVGKSLTVNYISYKTSTIALDNADHKVVLTSR